jgi:hypothetical protein
VLPQDGADVLPQVGATLAQPLDEGGQLLVEAGAGDGQLDVVVEAELPDGRVQLSFKRPWSDGTNSVALAPLALIARPAAIVPSWPPPAWTPVAEPQLDPVAPLAEAGSLVCGSPQSVWKPNVTCGQRPSARDDL